MLDAYRLTQKHESTFFFLGRNHSPARPPTTQGKNEWQQSCRFHQEVEDIITCKLNKFKCMNMPKSTHEISSFNPPYSLGSFATRFAHVFSPKPRKHIFFGGGGGEYIWSDFCPPNSPCKTCVFLGVFLAGSEKNYIYIVFGYKPKSCDKKWKYTCIYFLLYHYTFKINIGSWRTQISTIIPRLAGQSV